MGDFLDVLVKDSKRMVECGYYNVDRVVEHEEHSLMKSILRCKGNPIIAEIKLSSPSRNTPLRDIDVVYAASVMRKGNAVGISVLTEPNHFKGSLSNFMLIRENTPLPLLMKDFIVSQVQVDVASKIGADAILLIQALFDRSYCNRNLNEMIEYAHSHNMEVLLETHNEDEFRRAVSSDADLIGINNRDLRDLSVNLHVTEEILKHHSGHDRIIVTESGIKSPTHVHFLKEAGAHAFLVGTAIMSAHDIEEKVRELTEA